MPDLEVMTVVGHRYQITNFLARGGMGTVYRAMDVRLERPVALKVLHDHFASDQGFISRLSREAKAAARLAHPHVVNVLDQGDECIDGRPLAYLVMEYVPGYTLRDVLKRKGRVPVAEALRYFAAIIDGLAAAHNAGIVHRDVKPDNVLLTDQGQIKLADFGLARPIALSTNSGILLGTPQYLPPEILLGRVADASSDVYAVGILLYEMLTGQLPFDGENPLHIAYLHTQHSVPPPSAEIAEIPEELDELVLWCTASDPQLRPPNAGILLAELPYFTRNSRNSGNDPEAEQKLDPRYAAQKTQDLTPHAPTVLFDTESPSEANATVLLDERSSALQTPLTVPLSDQAVPVTLGEAPTSAAAADPTTAVLSSTQSAKLSLDDAPEQHDPVTEPRNRRALIPWAIFLLLLALGTCVGWFIGNDLPTF